MKRLGLALAAVIVIAGGAAALYYLGGYGSGASDHPITAAAQRSSVAAGMTGGTAVAAPANSDLLAPGPLEDQVLGKADAPVTIIEYASLTCPHCAAFETETFPVLKEKYIDTGKVRFILREFPLDNFATAGFMIARCAGPGKYYPVVDAFFKQQSSLMGASDPLVWLQNFAKQIGLTQEETQACLTNQDMMDGVMAVRQRAAEKFGVNSTPTFFINGKIHRGAMSPQELEKEIEPLLRS